jgi:hypothetical protein
MPEQPRREAQIDAVKRLQAQRRARRGFVAGYIHELSARHPRLPAAVAEPVPAKAA